MATAKKSLTIGLLVLASAGCFGRKKSQGEPVYQAVTLEVVNNNWQDIVIYAIVGSSRQRLGSVPAVKHATLELPSGLIPLPGSVQLLLDPLGSRATYRTGMISIGLGQQIRLVVENQLSLTNWTVQ
jgi:hypothetical protein